MSHSKTICMALLIALLLAFFGEWWGFGAMVAVAIFETYREYKVRKLYYALWELQNTEGIMEGTEMMPLEDDLESSERIEQ